MVNLFKLGADGKGQRPGKEKQARKLISYKLGFPSLGTTNSWAREFFVGGTGQGVGGRGRKGTISSVHCRMLGSIPDLG